MTGIGLGALITELRDSFENLWHFQILTLNGTALTVGTVISATVLILGGAALARRLSHRLAYHTLPRLGVSRPDAAGFEPLAFYTLLMFFSLMALEVLNVPLTIFTLAGGALAIGVGFGSQNLVNNFISGLILIIERPIRVGDTVRLEAFEGRILSIGARSTHVYTPDGVEVVVPNSVFLERPIQNLTLSDPKSRRVVSLCVPYGTKPEKVSVLLLQAAQETPGILADPPPSASIADFTDTGIVFRLFYWVMLGSPPTPGLDIDTHLRSLILTFLAQKKIEIPAPRRAVQIEDRALTE